MTRPHLVIVAIASLFGSIATAGELVLETQSPAAGALAASPHASIHITFDRAVDPSTITPNSVHAFGRWSGAALGALTVSDDGRTVTLNPTDPFSAGETVMVVVSHDVRGADGTPFRSSGASWQYWTRAGLGSGTYTAIQTMTTRTTPGESSRAYGGVACDMNHDGFMDLTIVNEDTADVRVFLNRADGSGRHHPFLQPTEPVGNRASPCEPADFNGDGHTDMCVCNINDDTVSVLLGVGDGTFLPQQLITVGGDPRGIVVLDADGDGDLDIVNTNATSSSLSIMINDGTGHFGAASFFEGGGSAEWALGAADMNGDALLDLIVGARSSSAIIVHLANGDGTFTAMPAQSCGGAVWMLNVGDLNGDGHADVATANSLNNTGAILFGNGDGTLAPPVIYATDSFPIATDLGDLDGDGDLDWLTSSFSGDWQIFRNDGSGSFTAELAFPAPAAASCALPVDLDNDGDLDVALIDELEDVVILMRQDGAPCPADLDGSGDVGLTDVIDLLAAWGPCPACSADLNGDGAIEFGDLLLVLAAWGPC